MIFVIFSVSTCLFSTQTSSKNPIRNTKVMYKDLFFSREVKSFFVKLVARALLHTISTQKFAFYPHCFTSLKRNLALWSTSAASAHLLSFPQGSSEASGDQEAAMINECCIIRFHIMFEVNFSLNQPC